MDRGLIFAIFGICLALISASEGRPTLTAHVIAHTHDDVGWLKTVDQYYVGMNESIQDAGVQYIIDEAVAALLVNPARKFTYVEIAFFTRWWNEQTPSTQEIVKNLVANGQLEFINGGWCMNDEANIDYTAIIDQMTDGHQFLYNTFGVRPRIGWHIDPFGHASTQASIFAQMGFDAFIHGRIDWQDHEIRAQNKNLEFVWRGSQSLGATSQIFTHVLYSDYCYPDNFGWEYGADPVQDDNRLFDYNLPQMAATFVAEVEQRWQVYRTTNILIPLGCDFQYQNNKNFKNMDKLMAHINANPDLYNLNVVYSTPSIYIDSVHAANLTWSVKTDDFFPYADDAHSYWTGYFTSRPTLKGYIRSRTSLLHAADKLLTTAALPSTNVTDALGRIQQLSYAHSVAQHHDAVAGTEKQHVAYDYAQRLSIGSVAAEGFIALALGAAVSNGKQAPAPTFTFCPLLNQSTCPALTALSQGQSVPFVAYNHLGWSRTENFVLPIPVAAVTVVNASGAQVISQVYPDPNAAGAYLVAFSATLPPLGYTTFVISKGSSKSSTYVSGSTPVGDSAITNEFFSLTFSGTNGRLSSAVVKATGQSIQISQDFFWYNASAGNPVSGQTSGAYIFRPNGTSPFPVNSGPVKINVVTGPVVSEVQQYWNPWAYQTFRLFAGSNRIEVIASVGPVDISDGLGKEVISRWSSSLHTNQTWYTDSEGQEFQQRILNYRQSWSLNVTEPVSQNYYPMNFAAYINDPQFNMQLTVLTDRSRGASSLADGQLETMIHRRLLLDDFRGVGEPLNETTVVRTHQYVELAPPSASARLHRPDAVLLNNQPVLAFSTAASAQSWLSSYTPSFSALNAALPPNVHLLTLKTMPDGQVLLRLNHIYAVGEDAQYSQLATVDLGTLFTNLTPVAVNEMSMTANQPASEVNRLQWNTVDGVTDAEHAVPLKDFVVTLSAQQTRTFLVRFQA